MCREVAFLVLNQTCWGKFSYIAYYKVLYQNYSGGYVYLIYKLSTLKLRLDNGAFRIRSREVLAIQSWRPVCFNDFIFHLLLEHFYVSQWIRSLWSPPPSYSFPIQFVVKFSLFSSCLLVFSCTITNISHKFTMHIHHHHHHHHHHWLYSPGWALASSPCTYYMYECACQLLRIYYVLNEVVMVNIGWLFDCGPSCAIRLRRRSGSGEEKGLSSAATLSRRRSSIPAKSPLTQQAPTGGLSSDDAARSSHLSPHRYSRSPGSSPSRSKHRSRGSPKQMAASSDTTINKVKSKRENELTVTGCVLSCWNNECEYCSQPNKLLISLPSD